MKTQAIQEIRERLRVAQEALARSLAGISEVQFHKAHGEEEWSPAEVVAHVCESPRLAVANVLRMATEDNPAVGRTAEDLQIRVRTLAEHAGDNLVVALDRLTQANAEVLKTVASLSDDQLERKGLHRQWGEVTVKYILDRLVSHYEEHARQISSILAR